MLKLMRLIEEHAEKIGDCEEITAEDLKLFE